MLAREFCNTTTMMFSNVRPVCSTWASNKRAEEWEKSSLIFTRYCRSACGDFFTFNNESEKKNIMLLLYDSTWLSTTVHSSLDVFTIREKISSVGKADFSVILLPIVFVFVLSMDTRIIYICTYISDHNVVRVSRFLFYVSLIEKYQIKDMDTWLIIGNDVLILHIVDWQFWLIDRNEAVLTSERSGIHL